jgi:hypothetical protein
MTIQPDSADPETTGSIFDRLASTIANLSPISNFSANSPERAIVGGISDELRERQHELLSVQLSARAQFAGKEIDEDDLRELDVDPEPVDLDLLNSFQSDQDLDLLVRRNGISRDPGSFATGEVVFQITADTAVIDTGVPVTTEPDGSGEVRRFETTESVSASAGDTQLTVAVEATERGTQSNVGVGQLTRLPSPPPFVSSVSNTTATSGGEDEETNAELRERFRQGIVGSSGGGTTSGVKSGLIEAVDGLDQGDVIIDEAEALDTDTTTNAEVIGADLSTTGTVVELTDTADDEVYGFDIITSSSTADFVIEARGNKVGFFQLDSFLATDFVSSGFEAPEVVDVRIRNTSTASGTVDAILGAGGEQTISFDVIVNGGASDAVIRDEINRLQPVAVDGQLIRPSTVTVDVSVDLTGTNIQTGDVETAINQFISGLGLGTDLIRDQLISEIVRSDTGIRGLDALTVTADGLTVSDDLVVDSRESPEPGTITVTVV